jgi:hypothetical protein
MHHKEVTTQTMIGFPPVVWALGLWCLPASSFLSPYSTTRQQAGWRQHTNTPLFNSEEERLNDEDSSPLSRLTSPPPDNLLQLARSRAAQPETTRRLAFASALLTAGALLGADEVRADNEVPDAAVLAWKANPINKRSGVTLFDAEKYGYNVQFITYLARFLLSFDVACQRWWFTLDLPRSGTAEEINERRLDQFGAFAASIEVGLQEFKGPDGPENLMKSLLQRYCPEIGPKTDGESEKKKQKRREIKEARRQIALLFGLLMDTQPVKELTALLAAIENGSIKYIQITSDPGLGGYAPGDEAPIVEFPAPDAGENYDPAAGRAILEPSGKLLRIEVVNGGSKYKTTPLVTVTAPQQEGGKVASAKAKLFSSGPNKGSVEGVELLDPGSGYSIDQVVQLAVSPPVDNTGDAAVLLPVLELQVGRIEITESGCGYAVEKPLKVYVNAKIKGKADQKRIVAGLAYPEAEKSSFTRFRKDSDIKQVLDYEEELDKLYDLSTTQSVKATDSGSESNIPLLPLWGGKSTSSKLLRLLPNVSCFLPAVFAFTLSRLIQFLSIEGCRTRVQLEIEAICTFRLF